MGGSALCSSPCSSFEWHKGPSLGFLVGGGVGRKWEGQGEGIQEEEWKE